LITRTDRGSQYASNNYRRLLKAYAMVASMSRKADCWDNAVAESFFKTLKVERVYRQTYTTRNDARLDIVNWIEEFYSSLQTAFFKSASSRRSMQKEALWLHNLMYVESRQGQSQITTTRVWGKLFVTRPQPAFSSSRIGPASRLPICGN
jgi:hypothetical protein